MSQVEPSLSQPVFTALSEHGLATADRRLVVAVSGGADSLALLQVLVSAPREERPEILAAHLHHGMREASADRDVDALQDLCHDWGIRLVVERADVPAYAQAHRLSPEEAAREVRYAFLGSVARQTQADAVLTAHTADDQVESVLLHLLRGSGVPGLAGMRVVSPLEARPGVPRAGELFPSEAEATRLPVLLVRPLLSVWRSEIESYCQARGLPVRRDPTNYDLRYTRNRVRHELLPALRAYNRHVARAILRLSAFAADDAGFIRQEAEALWRREGEEEGAAARFPLATWRAAPAALRRALLRLAYERCRGAGADLESIHVLAASDLLERGPTGRRLSLPGGVELEVGYQHWELYAGARAAPPDLPQLWTDQQVLDVPGLTPLEGTGWQVRAEVGAAGPWPSGPLEALFDAEVMGPELWVRRWRPGDRFWPLGAPGRKSVHDLFVDAKVPRRLRAAWPIVATPAGVAWVVGLRIEHGARVTADTRRGLRLTFERYQGREDGS